ncbi:MAG: ATP-binding cassette domain-containing protein [Candidatus Competibacteraceae bacterium]|nr:ATP-binding cassette domain-containing protein [Candidatus Competibacteraceae bacterium]
MTLLRVDDLSMRFGGLLAVDGVSLTVEPREVFAIIGPNGAGKTTVFNCISGFYRPTGGRVTLTRDGRDQDLIRMLGGPFERRDFTSRQTFQEKVYYKMLGGSHHVARAGLARTFQNVRLFRNMTVVENLLVAQHVHLDTHLASGLFATQRYRASESEAMERAAYWLEKVKLLDLANREAGNLAYGQQRRLEIARCMITRPSLLLLDEPAAGLNPRETRDLDELIVGLRREHGVAVLLIEHDMSLVMGISDRILVMEHGRPIITGTPEEVRRDPRVIKAYLGEE